jgi:hypothetical protein
VHVIPGAYHGFQVAGASAQAQALERWKHDALHRAFTT